MLKKYPWDKEPKQQYPWDNEDTKEKGVFAQLEKPKIELRRKPEENNPGVFASLERNLNEAKKAIMPKALQPLLNKKPEDYITPYEKTSKKLWDLVEADKSKFLELNKAGKKTYLDYGLRHKLLKPQELTEKSLALVDKELIKGYLEGEEYKKLSPLQKIGKAMQGYVPPKEYLNEVYEQGKKTAVEEAKKPGRAIQYGLLNALSLETFNRGSKAQLGDKGLTDISAEAHPILTGAGTVAGYVLPMSAATKATAGITKGLTKGISSKLGKEIVKGAVAGAAIDTTQGLLNYDKNKALGENAKDIGKRTLEGAAYGVVGDLAMAGVGKLAKTVFSNLQVGKLSKIPVQQAAATLDNVAKELKPTAINSTGKFKVRNTALDNAINEYNAAIETIHNHFRTNQLNSDEMARIKAELGIDLDGIVKKLETAEQGISIKEVGARRNLANAAGVKELPKINAPSLIPNKKLTSALGALKPLRNEAETIGNINTLPTLKNPLKPQIKLSQIGLKNNKLPNTIINSKLAAPEVKRGLENLDLSYNPLKNSDTLEAAKELINTDYDNAIKRVKEGPATAENNAIGMELVRRLQNQKRYTEAIDIIETISKKATESGQAIQALSMWGRLTPEGMLKYIQRVFDKTNEELANQGFKDVKKLVLTEEFAKNITDRMSVIGSMAEGRVKTVEIAKVLRDIDEQIPKSIWRKVSTVQTMAQLLNTKTMVRNVAGNAIFGGLENLSNAIGTPIDTVISKLTGQRTTLLPSLKTQLEAGKVDLVEAVQDALMGIDTKGAGTKFELGKGLTFKSNTLLGKLEKGMNVGLKATDAGFSGAARAESLRQQTKIAGVTEPTPGMLEIADKVAKYRTFQDKNLLSQGFKDIKDGLNRLSGFFTGTKEWGLGDLVIKYATTPANILARGIDYSPVGALKAVNEALKPLKGKVFNQKEFVDALSRSVTGTGLIAIGYQLNKMGLITGAADKDKDVAALQRDIGQGEYKLNTTALGRYLTSFDTAVLEPQAGDTYVSWDWTAPTSIMLGIGANVSQNRGNASDLLTTIVNATASGMNTIFEQPLLTGVKRFTGGYDQTQNLINTVQGLPSSFTPSALNQVKQLTDNTTRNTYDPNIAKETLNLVKARIPGLSKTLEPRITTLGQPKETYSDNSNSFLNVLLNPSNTSKYTPTPGAEMVLDIYRKSGEKIQFPRVAMTYIMDKGEKINLLPAEITKLQTIMGEKTATAFNRIALDKNFRNQKPEVQAKKLQSMLTAISQEAKQELLKDIRKRVIE